MSDIILGKNQYGKAENRVVRIYRDTPRHEIHDVNVSTCLRGDFSAAHLAGDQADVLPTDTQKQTAYAYAKEKGLQSIEDYGLALARHFVHDVGPVEAARIEIEEYAWQRATVDGVEHDYTWIRKGQEVRTAAVTVDAQGEWVVAGLKDFIILKSTGSEFAGFLKDEYTILQPTHDRVMATSLVAQWRGHHAVVGGLQDGVLVLQEARDFEPVDFRMMKSTGSEFAGFLKDEYTPSFRTHGRFSLRECRPSKLSSAYRR